MSPTSRSRNSRRPHPRRLLLLLLNHCRLPLPPNEPPSWILTLGSFCSFGNLQRVTRCVLFLGHLLLFKFTFVDSHLLLAAAVCIHSPCYRASCARCPTPTLLLVDICFQFGATMDSDIHAICLCVFWCNGLCMHFCWVYI